MGSGAVAATAGDGSVPHLALMALVWALTVGFLIVMIGRASGAHVNPAITVAAVLKGSFPSREAPAYLFAQLLGGLAAGFALSLFFAPGASSSNLGACSLGAGTSQAAGFALEAAGTFVLAMAALNAGALGRVPPAAVVVPVLFAVIFAIGFPTGASLNPARSVGPQVAASYFENFGLYIAAPTAGAALAGLLSRRWNRAPR